MTYGFRPRAEVTCLEGLSVVEPTYGDASQGAGPSKEMGSKDGRSSSWLWWNWFTMCERCPEGSSAFRNRNGKNLHTAKSGGGGIPFHLQAGY